MPTTRVFIDVLPLADLPAGIPIYTLRLIEQLLKRRDEVALSAGFATLRPWKLRPISETLRRCELDIELVRAFLPTRVAYRSPGLASWFGLRPVDLVHATNYLPPPWVRAPRTVLTIHDLAFLRSPDRQFTSWESLAARLPEAARRAQAILAVSEFTKRETCELLGVREENVFVSHLGPQWSSDAPTDAQVASVLSRVGLDSRGYLLSVGTLSPRKNHGTLLEAFRALRKRHDDARLVLVGRRGWGDEALIEAIGRFGPSVIWLDGCPDEDLRALYRGARAFALVSWYEGFGIPTLEAMGAGCPVCYATGSSMDEVVGDAGLAVSPGNTEQIAEAISTLWSDEELCRSLARRGRERATLFSWERTADETLRAYAHAMQSGG